MDKLLLKERTKSSPPLIVLQKRVSYTLLGELAVARRHWRRVTLIVVLLLPLLINLPYSQIPTAALSNKMPNDSKPIPPYGGGNPVGQYTGSGDSTEVFARYNKTASAKTETTDAADFTIQNPSNWQTYLNVSLDDVTATYPVILDIETNQTSVEGYPPFSQEPYMSFKLTNSCYLHSLQSYINRNLVRPGPDARIWIYNATDSSGTPRPETKLYLLPEDVEFVSAGISWINHTFSSPIFLNTSNTYDNTFFVNWENQGSAQAAWGFRDDALSPPDNGYVWLGPVHTSGYDCMMNITILPLGQFPTPQQIDLRINGSSVNDMGTNSGWWESTFTEPSSSVFFDISATWPITLNFTYLAIFNQTFIGTTAFLTNYQLALANWNITASVTFPNVGADSNSRILNFSLPSYWTVQFLYNGSTFIPAINYQVQDSSSTPGWLFIDEPGGAGNGTLWRVISTDSNYVQTPAIWRGATDVTGDEVNITDLLYVTAQVTTDTDGEGRFNPYDEMGTSLAEWFQTPVAGLLTFPSFTPNTYLITNVTMRCEVVWNNSYHVGVGLSSVHLVYPTTVSDNLGPYTSLIGDNVNIRVYYEDTYNIAGIENADEVNVTFGMSTYSLFDVGSGYYERSIDTSLMGLGRGVNVGLVKADRQGYASATTTVSLTLWSKTQLVANWTSLSISYTESVTLEVNYSVLTPLGEGGIEGAQVNISDPGPFFSVLSEEGGGNYTVLLQGTVLGVGTHNLVVNASKPGFYYQDTTLLVTLTVQGEATTISGSAPPSVNGGEAFNVTLTYQKQSDGTGIVGASVSCLLNGTPFTPFITFDLLDGTYHLQFILNTSGGDSTYNITLTISLAGYEPQIYQDLVDVLIRPSQLSVQVLSSAPVVYDTDFIIELTYQDFTPQGLVGAVVQGNWSTISFLDNLDGTYTVRCSTTGAPVGWWTITFNISVQNYVIQFTTQTFHLVWATSLTPENNDFTPSQYENETLVFDVTFINTNTGFGVGSATVWAVFQTTTYPLTSQGNGVYRLILNLTGITPTSYAVDVFAQRTNHQNQTISLTLEVLAKLTPILTLQLPTIIYPGTQIAVTIGLTLENGSVIVGGNVDLVVWVQYANGTSVSLASEAITTDVFGLGLLFVQIPSYVWDNGNTDPYLWASAEYDGACEIATIFMIASEAILPLTDMPWWAELLLAYWPLLVLIVLIIIIGSVIYVKRVRPSKLARQRKLEESGGMWAQRIMGLMDLRALFVTYSKTGLPIFTYDFAGGEMPSTLLAGFISAVNSFYSELSGEVDRESQLRDIHYKDLHLSLREGTHIVSVLILDSSPSEEITESLASFTTQFETRFGSELERFDGRIDMFDPASEIVEASFHGELLLAYECAKPPSRGFPRKIYALAVKLANKEGRLFLPQLFVAAVEKYGSKKKFDIANALEQLHDEGCFIPVNASPFPNPSQPDEAVDFPT